MDEYDFFEVLGYLTNPNKQCKLDAEMHPNVRDGFESRYVELTGIVPQPDNRNYYIWSEDANKWGLELRVYFYADSDNIPLTISSKVVTSRPGMIQNRRINGNDLIWHLIEYGFLLSDTQDEDRIRNMVPNQFIDDFNRGYQIS